MHATNEWGYGRAIRESAADDGLADVIAKEIPLPGLPDSRSQLAVPLLAGGALVGVLFVEDVADRRFGYDDEDALLAIAGLLGPAIRGLQACADDADDAPGQRPGQPSVLGPPLKLRHYVADDSIFVDDDYLIKGVAGAILWKLVGDYARAGRTDFTNRELRLDPQIRLPDLVRQSRGAPHPAAAAPGRAQRRRAHREDGPRPFPPVRAAADGAAGNFRGREGLADCLPSLRPAGGLSVTARRFQTSARPPAWPNRGEPDGA